MSFTRRKSQSPSSTTHNLPPPREKRGLRPVTPPLSKARLNRFIYALITLTALLGMYYSYRLMHTKTQVGGWWNLILGRKLPTPQIPVTHESTHVNSVEDKINDLAKALGIPSRDLASAIAVAVRNYVPPASLSSIAAQETGPAVQALLKEPPNHSASQTSAAESAPSTGILGEVIGGFVGMDEP